MNPRYLKYKQVSTLHDCSGSTVSVSGGFSDSAYHHNTRVKGHQTRQHRNRSQYAYEYDLDYDMMEISSDEEEVEDQ